MKRPYGEGDWFAVPLGDGRFGTGLVTHGTRKAICGSFFGPAAASLAELEAPAVRTRDAASAVWSGRFSDRALVQSRWPLLGRHPAFARGDWPAAAGRAAEPGEVEARLAALLSGRPYERGRMTVFDIADAGDLLSREGSGGRMRVQWRTPLSPGDLAAVARFVAAGDAGVRIYGAAVSQVGELALWAPFERLAFDAVSLPDALPVFPGVRELEIDGVPDDPAAVFASFPSLESVRVRARGATMDAASFASLVSLRALHLDTVDLRSAGAIADLPSLRALDLCDARIDDVRAVLAMPLDAVRLIRVEPLRSLAALRGNETLRVLSVGGAVELEDLRPIATLTRLESLELAGLWQFDVGDASFVESMPSLRRLYLDIGGRRKNVELYKRRPLSLPLPWPFIAF